MDVFVSRIAVNNPTAIEKDGDSKSVGDMVSQDCVRANMASQRVANLGLKPTVGRTPPTNF
jgi:hypothetical protein